MKLSKNLLMFALAGGIAFGAGAEHLKSLNAKGIDPNTQPGEDFYTYVNKGWIEANPLTPEYARYGSFNVLADSSQHRLQRIIDGLATSNHEPGSSAWKVATLYKAGMDSVRRNQLGAQPIKADLAKIENTNHDGMEDLFYWMHKYYGSPLIGAGPMADMMNSQELAMYVVGAGLTLGDRDYYLVNDKRNKEIRTAYDKLIVGQMMNAGYSKKDAQRIAKNVMKIETLLADSTWTREESRNHIAQYNPRAIDELQAQYPEINWRKFFDTTMGINPEKVILTTPNTIAQGTKLYKSLSDRELKDLYLWEYVSAASPYLSDDFANTAFEFNKVMSGVEQMRPRWKRVQGVVENSLGEALGELYVAEYFPESSKQYMIGLVENLRSALAKHIMHLPWMSDDTKVQALSKLNAITVKIGYPDKWKDYSAMVISPELSYWENIHNVNMWANDEYLAKWGKPVDRTEWGMTPQTVNAYYNPLNNEIVFPAGILQAPFFDPQSSDAENYGGIGVVIGHEMTHGFDDQGCNFDKDGNMINWWTAEDKAAFDNLTKGLVAQFDEVEVLPGLNANGTYTLGENIADQGGLRVAYTAFLDSQKKKGVDINSAEAKIDGFDPTQVFYMNYANLWAQNIRDEEIRSLTTGDVHSLGNLRVNVSLRNIQPFLDAFNITNGQKMFRPASEQVIIW